MAELASITPIRPKKGTALEDFDKGWAHLLAEIVALQKRDTQLGDEIFAFYTEGATAPRPLPEVQAERAEVRNELASLMAVRADEEVLRQRARTATAETRYAEIDKERHHLERKAADTLADMLKQAKVLAASESALFSVTERDAELQAEQIGCNDRGLLKRSVDGSLRGLGSGNAANLMEQIERDLAQVAHRLGDH